MRTIILSIVIIMLSFYQSAQAQQADTLSIRQQRIVAIAATTAQGITDAVGREASPVADEQDKYTRGAELLEKLSGAPADAPKTGYAAFAPVIEQYLKEHLFCDIFERDLLTWQERELATVSILTAMGEGVEPMLKSHSAIAYGKVSPRGSFGK